MLTVGAQQIARGKDIVMKVGVPWAPFPHICAHRGLSHACPENTLPAFAAAMAVGAHEIEFDVILTNRMQRLLAGGLLSLRQQP
jgi:glycerophosphoryl diester phosphodiesterase